MGCSGSKSVEAVTGNNLYCLSCIDGRTTEEIMGCPGGDAGLLLRCLYSCKQVSPDTKELDDDTKISEIILEVSKNLHHLLYYHTDERAIRHFDAKNAKDYNVASKGINIGCGYFKLCCTAPAEVGEDQNFQQYSKKFVICMSKTYSQNQKSFDYVILKGEHAEDNVKLFHSKKPFKADGKTFIYHPNVESSEGQTILDTIFEMIPALAAKKDEIVQKCQEVNSEHWKHTINYLAPGKEIQEID